MTCDCLQAVIKTSSLVLQIICVERQTIMISQFCVQFTILNTNINIHMLFAKRPTNAQGSSGCFINTFQIFFYLDMFWHMVAILRGS
jgi:hypothetical protein